MSKWTPEEDETLARLREQGWTNQQIAFHMERPYYSVEARASRIGLTKQRKAKTQPALRPAPATLPMDPDLVAAATATVRRYAIDQADAEQLLDALGIGA